MKQYRLTVQAFGISLNFELVAGVLALCFFASLNTHRCDAVQSEQSDIRGTWIEREDHSFALASSDRTIPGVALLWSEPATQRYEGTVFGADGKPAIEADVWFSGFYGKIPLREKTKTNGDGKYSIAIPDLDDIGNVRWTVAAFLNQDSSPLVSSPATKDVRLEMVRGRQLTLRLSEINREPIMNFTAHLEDGRLISSDAEGKCVIQGLAPKVQYIGLTAAGYVSQFWMMDLYDERDVEYTHFTVPGGTVSGIVHDEERKPVPWNEVTGRTSEMSIFTVGHTFSNDKGEYRLSGLYLNRRNQVAAFSHRFGDLTYSNDSEVVFSEKSTTAQCDFEVTPNQLQPPNRNRVYSLSAGKPPVRGFFRGKVTLPDGKPCTNFRVRFSSSLVAPQRSKGYSASYESIGIIYSSPDGTFVFSDVPVDGAFRISVSANGFQDQFADPAIGVSSKDLADSDSIDIQLKAASSVRVVVRDAQGNAVEGAQVALYRAKPKRVLEPYYKDTYVLKGITAQDGTVELQNVPLNEGRWLVSSKGFPEQQFAFEGESESTFQLTEGVSLTMNLKVVGETDHELALMLTTIDGRVLHNKEGIPIENAQWVIKDLLPDRYLLRFDTDAQGGSNFYFVDGVGNPTSKMIDIVDGAGKSKEFTFELKPR